MNAEEVAKAIASTESVWGFGGWALSKDALTCLCQHIDNSVQSTLGDVGIGTKPIRILELGGGQSTLFWNALSATSNISVTTLEHDFDWVQEVVKRLGDTSSVRIVHSPLKQITDDEFASAFMSETNGWEKSGVRLPKEENNSWTIHNAFYEDIHKLELKDESIDVMVVDGPHGNGRSLAYPLFSRYLKKDALILIDDFDHYPFLKDLEKVFSYKEIHRSTVDKHWILIKRTSMSNSFRATLDRYTKLILSRQPMCMYRFADGEMLLVDGIEVGANTQAFRMDRWRAPARLTALGSDLRNVLDTQGPCFHFGISCPCCDGYNYNRLSEICSDSPIFPVNLFINANYNYFLTWVKNLPSNVPIALIRNVRAGGKMPFNVVLEMTVPDDCVNFYESFRSMIAARAREFCRGLNRTIVFVAAGPLSEVLIFFMWNENPNNTYVDVGSSLDEFSHGAKTRPYMFEGTTYANQNCALP